MENVKHHAIRQFKMNQEQKAIMSGLSVVSLFFCFKKMSAVVNDKADRRRRSENDCAQGMNEQVLIS